MYAVGSTEFSTHGAHGAQRFIQIIHFFYWKDCLEYIHLKYNNNINITCITPHYILSESNNDNNKLSTQVENYNFNKFDNVCFIIGEKDG